jgi:hypothetical protein
MALIFGSWATRKWILQRSQLEARVKNFRVADAQCAVEADRDIVLRNILKFMREKGFADDEVAAPEAFDALVHKEVPGHLHQNFGRTGIPFYVFVIMFTPITFETLDLLGTDLQQGLAWDDSLTTFVCHNLITFTLGPIFIGLNQLYQSCFPGQRHKAVEWFIIISGGAGQMVLLSTVFWVYYEYKDLKTLTLIVLLAVTIVLYVPKELMEIPRKIWARILGKQEQQISSIEKDTCEHTDWNVSWEDTCQHSIVPVVVEH